MPTQRGGGGEGFCHLSSNVSNFPKHLVYFKYYELYEKLPCMINIMTIENWAYSITSAQCFFIQRKSVKMNWKNWMVFNSCVFDYGVCYGM